MENTPIPKDDVLDVMEMTRELEIAFSEILEGNELHLAMSALMSASINCILRQCSSLDDVMFYKRLFNRVYSTSVSTIRVQGPEESSSSS